VAVTQEEVNWCYDAILGRSPESADVVQRHASTAKDFRSLVLNFFNSAEYRIKHSLPILVPLDRGAMDVQTAASATQLALLKDRIRTAWSHLGAVRPHYSVLTNKQFLPESIDEEAIERFYASGLAEALTIESILSRHGFADPESKVCVEYGCGLGRVTLALAKMFKSVQAYDISANHLELAGRRAADAKIGNIVFHLCCADRVIENLKACDFFYSRIVLQHNPPPVIRELIVAALNSLRERGIAIFQVPTYMEGYSFRIDDYLAKPQLLNMEMHCIPQQDVFPLIAEAQCTVLEVREDRTSRLGEWISNTFVVQRLAGRRRTAHSRSADEATGKQPGQGPNGRRIS
jgi:SAM-dependent methyltransferase